MQLKSPTHSTGRKRRRNGKFWRKREEKNDFLNLRVFLGDQILLFVAQLLSILVAIPVTSNEPFLRFITIKLEIKQSVTKIF